jgi:tetratricopeptide (TPR) repeat protein
MSRQSGSSHSAVRVWEEMTAIPTYGIGEPDKNPMFLEKRVYQGSSGRVYPHPVIDKIKDEKEMKEHRIVVLENEYLRIEIMPDLGGRIYRALDKTNQYDFVYYNRVIKPALVGLTGPWISGGIEFNWPQHHRPNTFGPVEYSYESGGDGSATVWVSEIDRMYGTKMTAGFTLYPGKAYLEISGQLYNRTDEPQTFLWWANPAVAVNDHTQSVFPPDVIAVFDHGKRDVSRFPIATGTYYKMDYSEGVDISRYKNIPVPTSYMAYKSDYNFIGGYDHGVQAGLLHVANRHISPGKKQWTWGCGDFGQAWDRNLTDEDGPYIELMTGVFTDNQPDFSWLMPGEEKTFKQYFMPYKNIGVVKNASVDAAVNLEIDEETRRATVQAYATGLFGNAVVELRGAKRVYLNETVTLSPTQTCKFTVTLDDGERAHELRVSVRDANGRELIAYRPKRPEIERVPDPAEPLPDPEELKTNEQLYLAGLHLEQYRHATFEPDAYYLEGLKRDASDIRINVAYGTLLLRRGLFEQAEKHFRRAIKSLTWRNPNPYDSEAFYQLGLALLYQGRLDEAFAAFYKSTWSSAWQMAGFFALAQIAARQGRFDEALELIEQSLVRNIRNYRARHLKAALLRKLGRLDEALAFADETLELDVADFGSANERALCLAAAGLDGESRDALAGLARLMRGNVHNYMTLAADYAGAGMYEEAIGVLSRIVPDENADVYPMLHYALAYLHEHAGNAGKAAAHREGGRRSSPDYCFPNSLFDLLVLEHALDKDPSDDRAHYLLGNLLYDKKRPEDAIRHWEASAKSGGDYPTVHRNLALAYYNKRGDADAALRSLERAFALGPQDARVFYELDQLCKKLGRPAEERLARLLEYKALVDARDDLYIEYVTLLNTLGRHEDAIRALEVRNFHPWEGGEGKTTGQHVLAHVELAKAKLLAGEYREAIELLHRAKVYPANLGEGKLAGAQENHIHYFLGCAHEGLGEREEAKRWFEAASVGLDEPASAMYYNDQPPEMIFYQGLAWSKLGNAKEAKRRFNKLIDYAEKHLFDEVKMDYFAVSLPDFLVFEDDLNKRNRVHCRFMRGLGLLGLGRTAEAAGEFDEVLRLEPAHQGARIHKDWNMI